MKKFLLAGLVFAFAVALSASVKADSLSDIQAQIAAIMAQVQSLQNQVNTFSGGAGGSAPASGATATTPDFDVGSQTAGTDVSGNTSVSSFCYTFTRGLGVGASGLVGDSGSSGKIGSELLALFQALSLDSTGSTGEFSASTHSVLFFNEDIAASVVQFQAKYGIPQTGYVGPKTRAKLNSLYGCQTMTTQPSIRVYPTTLALTYDGNNQEVLLRATGSFDVTAGASMLYLNNQYPNVNFIDNGGKFQSTNSFQRSMSPVSSVATVAGAYGIQYYAIPAGTTAHFSFTASQNPKQMFAGQYYAKLQGLFRTTDPNSPNSLTIDAPNNQSNSVTIVGEVSPYITAVNGQGNNYDASRQAVSVADPGQPVTLTGLRFDRTGDTINFGNASYQVSSPDGASITFTPSTYGILAGSVVGIQVVSPTTGASNVWTLKFGGSASTQPSITSVSPSSISLSGSATITITGSNLYGHDARVSLRGSSGNVTTIWQGMPPSYSYLQIPFNPQNVCVSGDSGLPCTPHVLSAGSYQMFYVNGDNLTSNPVSFTITAPTSGGGSSGASLSVTTLTTHTDRAGAWNNFNSGVGNVNKSPDDWNWQATLTLSQQKSIKSVTLEHNTSGEVWSTSYGTNNKWGKTGYPLVIDYQNSQIDYGYDAPFLVNVFPAGTKTLYLYGQEESTTFTGGTLTVNFADGTSVSATVPTASGSTQSNQPIVITSVQYSPASPKVNDWITTTVTVKNASSADYSLPFQVDVQGTTVTVPSLVAGAQTIVTVPNAFTFASPGTQTLNTVIIYPIAGSPGSGNTGNMFTNTLTFAAVPTTSTLPSITVLSPNGGETWMRGTTQQVIWQSQFPVTVYLSSQNNLNGKYFVLATYVSSPFSWAVGQLSSDHNPLGAVIPDGQYYLCVANGDSSQSDCSNSYFTITTAPTPQTITVSTPASGQQWVAGATKTIQWSASNYTGSIGIALQNSSGGWTLANNISNSGLYTMTLPYTFQPGSDYYIRVSELDSNGNMTASGVSNNFTITAPTPTASGQVPSANNVIISLDSTTPISQNIMAGQVGVPVLRFKVANNSSQDINIGGFSVSISGARAGMDIPKVTLWDGSTKLIDATVYAVSSVIANLNNTAGTFPIIPAGSSKVFTVSGDISASAPSVSTATFTIYGFSFTPNGLSTGMPITGNQMTITPQTQPSITVTSPTPTAVSTALSVPTCTPRESSATVGQTVSWGVSFTGGSAPYSFTFRTQDNSQLVGTAPTPVFGEFLSYSTAGVKTAVVTVTDSNNYSVSTTCSGSITITAPALASTDSISFALASTTEDKTGGYTFGPNGHPDWMFLATLNLSASKTIQSMNISAGTEIWSTSDNRYYNIAVFRDTTGYNSSYVPTLFTVDPGTNTFRLYTEKWFATFNPSYVLRVTFTDGTSLSATVNSGAVVEVNNIGQLASALTAAKDILERILKSLGQ